MDSVMQKADFRYKVGKLRNFKVTKEVSDKGHKRRSTLQLKPFLQRVQEEFKDASKRVESEKEKASTIHAQDSY